MMRNSAIAVLLAATLAAPAVAQAGDARASNKYDGPWSVVVMTLRGPCDASYRFSGQIVNGIISYSYGTLEVSGRVASNGATFVRVTHGTDHGEGRGRLMATYGTGTWSGHGPNGICAGRWVATRAGAT
jgi:hypothetical protein